MSIRDVLAAASSSTALASRDVQWMYFTTSTTFTPSQDMEVNLHVLGSSGSGGAGWAQTGGVNATGPGAGGYSQKRATLKAGTAYTITIGAPGATVTASTVGTRLNGNDGSPTSFVGGTINVVANGGKGGKATATNVAALGGDGGTATGGDKNFTGGRGGNISPNATAIDSVARATGGGALNLLGTGDCNGGDLTGTNIVTTTVVQATGGGSCVKSAPSSAVNTNTGTLAGGNLALLDGDTANPVTLLNRSFFGKYNTIGPSGGTVAPGNFGGGSSTQPNPGLFGGGAGAVSSTGNAVTTGQATGTPGGAASTPSSSGGATSSNGRSGAVFMEILG